MNPVPIVGVGASAGGLDAFRQLLEALPADTGLAYVLVQHLDPHHESLLANILSKSTSMPVSEVKSDVPVEANRIYIVPPSRDIVLAEGILKLVPRTKTGGQHMPIDYFLRTLAAVQGSRAIGVILSGMASDGTLGLKAIKAEGGIAFAQDPASAQADGMPRSAIEAGCVDFVLPPAGIAQELARLGRHPYVTREATPGASRTDGDADPAEGPGLRDILALLLKTTGTDFTAYKPTTIRRRIARRMAVNRAHTLAEYAVRLEANPAEVQALYQDCLICVTSFFRDPDAFQALSERIFPRLMKDRPPDMPIRVWVAGCATGEEAYSLAMCLLERAGELAATPALQIFATDLSESALEVARSGKYLESIVQDVRPERLQRFFSQVDGHYQVSKAIREMCVFARHDLGRDPAFSRMDLITCRNVLIYLEPHLQEKVLASFHYALKPTGHLMLGGSETAGASSLLFDPVDKKHRIYSRIASTQHPALLFGARPPATATGTRTPPAVIAKYAGRAELPKEADRILLARYSPPSVVVDSALNILEFRGDTQPYLEHGRHGQASLNLMKMVRRSLLFELRQAVQVARETGAPARRDGLQFQYRNRLWKADLEVIPMKGAVAAERCLLVVFEGRAVAVLPEEPVVLDPSTGDARDLELARLRLELTETTQYLQEIVQEHEAANEELQSTNEEATSANEELQSVNEELVTAKEELQSSNEELATLNQELQDRNVQLGQLNDDLVNAFGSVDLPIVMVGSDLRLRRFTPAAEKLLRLVPADLGRPITDLQPDIQIPDLTRQIREVIDTASVADREVKDRLGRSYKLRISPYKTRENRVEGAVLAMVDVDALKRSAERVQQALEYASAIVETVVEPLLVLDSELRIEKANRAFYEDFHVTPEETEGRILFELGGGELDIPKLREALARVLTKDSPFEAFEVAHAFPRVGQRTMALSARRLRYERGDGAERILLALEDRTEVRRAEADRAKLLVLEQAARQKAELADHVKDEFVATVSHELRGPLTSMSGWIHVLRGFPPPDAATMARGLGAIERGVGAQTRLIEDLLDHSRIVAGKLQLALGIVDLGAIAQAAADSLKAAADEKGVALELSRGDTAAVIVADADRMQQVVWNLLSNALKFTDRGGRVQVSITRFERRFVLTVTDTGHGITAEFLPHVFERFRQEQGSASRSRPGLGIGLSIVRQLVELHGGAVSAESAGPGQGSTFKIALPIPAVLIEPEGSERYRRVGDLAPSHEPRPEPPRTLLGGLRVLVTEDETDAREAMASVLQRYGAEVTAAGSAGAAMESLRRGVPDVLVSDIGMPDEDGYALMRKVRALRPEEGGRVPALALTAYGGDDDRETATLAGFQAFVTKPVIPERLVLEVARMAGRDWSPSTF